MSLPNCIKGNKKRCMLRCGATNRKRKIVSLDGCPSAAEWRRRRSKKSGVKASRLGRKSSSSVRKAPSRYARKSSSSARKKPPPGRAYKSTNSVRKSSRSSGRKKLWPGGRPRRR